MVNQEPFGKTRENGHDVLLHVLPQKTMIFSNSQGVPLLKMTNPGTTQVCLQRSGGGRDGCSGGAGGCRVFVGL